jgi:hypothetical protein
MQAMHTPPDTSAALAFPGPSVDAPWTIFDQEIMSLANPAWLFDEPPQLSQMQRPSTQCDSSMLGNSEHQYTAQAQWDCAEQVGAALPSTLNRIFGNDGNGQNGNPLI